MIANEPPTNRQTSVVVLAPLSPPPVRQHRHEKGLESPSMSQDTGDSPQVIDSSAQRYVEINAMWI